MLVFDKTGTLTIGRPRVIEIVPLGEGLDERHVLRLAAAADRRSGHPLAKAVVAYAGEAGVDVPEPTAFEVLRGRGVKATVEDMDVLVGNGALLLEHRIAAPDLRKEDEGRTVVFVATGGRVVGRIVIADEIRPGAKEAIARLRATGIKRVVMLTGDNQATAAAVAAELAIDEIHAELMPEDKVKAVTALKAQGHRVAMVGDGINDAPALATADVGIAMGAGGTQAALEAADVALMTDDLSKIVLARAIARRAYRTIKENLIVGVGVVHIAGITAALFGLIGPIQAAIIHLGPDVLVFLNSVKLLRVRID